MSELLDTDVAIETPEHIVFRHRIAGPARRMVAQLLDLILCYGVCILVAVFVILVAAGAGAVSGAAESTANAGIGVVLLLVFAAQWIYFVAWEALKGTTPGKMALGLRVVTTEGRPIGFVEAALRNLLRAADALPSIYVVGGVAMALSPSFQRLGDLVAGTLVVIPDRTRVAAPIVLWPPAKAEEWRDVPDDVQLDADERAAIELFLRRRGMLGEAREHELAEMIAEPLLRRHGMGRRRTGAEMSRAIALLYDRAQNAGRGEAPPSSRGPSSWRSLS
jgi:uncharacterized RDD family membrane protein YckC